MKLKKMTMLFLNITLLFILLMALACIPLYIHLANNYNQPLLANHSPENIKKTVIWYYQYLMSFSLVFVSFLIISITQFSVLIANKNSFLISLLPILFLNKIKLDKENRNLQKRNFVASIMVLTITFLLLLISSVFSFKFDKLLFPIISILFLAVITIEYPLIFIFYRNGYKKSCK